MHGHAETIYDRLYRAYKLLIEAAAGNTGQSEPPATAEQAEPANRPGSAIIAPAGRTGKRRDER